MSKKSGLASLSQGSSDVLQIDPRKLSVRENWNTRDMNAPDNVEHIDMLAKSIAEIGVKEPLTAFWEDGKAYITNGHCRLLASIRAIEVYGAELKTVPVRSEERYGSEADRIFTQISRNSGKPFSALEQAKVFKKLLDLGWQQGDIAKKAGMSASRISQILDLLTLPEGVKTMVTNGHVSATMAVQVVKNEGSAAEQALKQGLATAKAEGKTKIKPSHMAETPKLNIRSLIKEVLDNSDVNDSGEEDVVLTIPYDMWKKLRDGVDW